MTETISIKDFATIWGMCENLLDGVPSDESLEDRVAFEYGNLGQYYALPFIFERVENSNLMDTAALLFGDPVDESATVTQEDIVSAADLASRGVGVLEEDEEEVVRPPVTPVAPPAKVEKPKVKVTRKPRKKTSESLTGQARPLYRNMFEDNPKVRNADAQRAIAGELGITDPKQLNSLRAMIVKFKKEMI